MLNFDARTVQPAMTPVPVPEGWYKVVIRKSNIKPTAKGDGGYLELQCEILEGQYQGRTLYWNLNLFNQSQTAVEIAYKQLSAICHVVGQFQVQSTQSPDTATPMLHNIPFMVFVVVAQGTQGSMNNIRGCKDIHGNDPGKQAGPPVSQPAGAAPGAWAAPQPPAGSPAPYTAAPGYAPPSGPPATAQPPQGGWQAPPAGPPATAPQQPQPPWQPGTNVQPQYVPQQPQQPQQPQPTYQPTTPAQAPQQPSWSQTGGQPQQAPWTR